MLGPPRLTLEDVGGGFYDGACVLMAALLSLAPAYGALAWGWLKRLPADPDAL